MRKEIRPEDVVDNFPAYMIVRRELTNGIFIKGRRVAIDFTDIYDSESLGLRKETSRGVVYKEFKPGSVVSYALQNHDDPIAEVARAVERKHQLHWLNACGSAITSQKRPQEVWTLVQIGMLVRFEGRLFTIQRAPNDNLNLVPFDLPDTTQG
jgi:hypothetical protein